MKFLKEVYESFIATAVIVAIVGFLCLVGAVPYNSTLFLNFVIGAVLLVFGKSIFMTGIDTSILPVGKAVGSELMKRKKVWIIILFSFLFALVSTIAEPDVQLIASQITDVNPIISSFLMVFIISLGCALLTCFGLLRILKNIPLKWIMLILYGIIIVLSFFCPPEFLGFSLDAGGATTGAITVPFLLSLTVGICALKGANSKNDSFGVIAVASTGPIIALLILGIIAGAPNGEFVYNILNPTFLGVLSTECLEVAVAFLPLLLTFLITQFLILKMHTRQFLRIILGFAISYIGLVLFLTGVYFGFNAMAGYLGEMLAVNVALPLILVIGLVIGFTLVYTEPAVAILAEQVEEVTTGFMNKKVILLTMGIGIGIAVVVAFLNAMLGINLLILASIMFVIAIILNFFIPKIFVGIAFDSGGAASGTMLVAFILPMCFGLCEVFGTSIMLHGFGVVGIVATMPIIILQILGIIYKIQKAKIDKKVKENADRRELEND